MKKFGIYFLGFFALLIIIISMVPLFVSVDDYRPQIQKMAQEQVRGKVEIGKLSLSTFPSISVSVESLKATPPGPLSGAPLLEVQDLSVSMPLYSLLFGPKLNISLDSPKIAMTTLKDGRSSLSEFLPLTGPDADPKEEVAQDSAQDPQEDPMAAMPMFVRSRVLKAKLNLEINKAKLLLDNRVSGEKTTLDALDFYATNLGLNEDMQLRFATQIAHKTKGISLEGPLSISGTFSLAPEAQGVYLAKYLLEMDLSSLKLVMGESLNKASGVEFKLLMQGTAKKAVDTDVDMQKLEFVFGGLQLSSKMKYFMSAKGDKDTLNFSINSKAFDLSGLQEIVPMVGGYQLGGQMSLSGNVKGSVANPSLDMKLSLAKVTGATPGLKLPIEDLKGDVSVSGSLNQPVLNVKPFSLRIGSSDLSMTARVVAGSRPDIDVSLNSNRFNVDELMGTQSQAEAQESAKGGASGGGGSETAANQKAEALDESLEKMAPELEKSLSNPMLDKLTAKLAINAKSFRFSGGEFTKTSLNLGYKPRSLSITNTGLSGYSGRLNVGGVFGLYPKAPSYNIGVDLKDVSVDQVMASHMPNWKDEISGTLNGDLKVVGKGIRKKQIDQSLRGGLNGQLLKGRTSIPVVKMISGVLEKLPQKVQDPAKKKGEGKVFNGEFKKMLLKSSFQGRKIIFNTLDIIFDAEASNLGDLRFQGDGSLSFDRYIDFKGVAYLPKNIQGLDFLKGSSGQPEVPLKFKGDMSSPETDYGYSVSAIGKKSLSNLAKSPEAKKVEKRVKEEIKKLKVPEPAKKAVDDFKKKFGF